jgi:hypothetical protein
MKRSFCQANAFSDDPVTRLLLACGLALASCCAQANEAWFLFARHGDCFPIQSLKRELPDLPEVRDPEAFTRFLKGKGYQYSVRPQPLPVGQAVEVHVPDQGLALMFVTAEHCQAAKPDRR